MNFGAAEKLAAIHVECARLTLVALVKCDEIRLHSVHAWVKPNLNHFRPHPAESKCRGACEWRAPRSLYDNSGNIMTEMEYPENVILYFDAIISMNKILQKMPFFHSFSLSPPISLPIHVFGEKFWWTFSISLPPKYELSSIWEATFLQHYPQHIHSHSLTISLANTQHCGKHATN